MADDSSPGRSSLLPLATLTLVVLIWASNTIASKLVLRDASPVLLALVRFSIAAAIFYLPVFLIMRRVRPPLRRGEEARLAVAGMLGSASSVLLFTIGVSMTPATEAGLMLMTAPIWTALIAWLIMRERLGRGRALGMTIAFLGAGVLATNGRITAPDPEILVGSAFLLGAQIAWSVYTLITKPLLGRRPPLLVLTASHLFGVSFLWPAAGLLGAWSELSQVFDWPLSTWLVIVYMAVVNSALSQTLYLYGLREVSASQAMSFMYLQPVFTAILAAIFLDERPGPLTFVCGALIVLGLWIVNRPRSGVREKPVVVPSAIVGAGGGDHGAGDPSLGSGDRKTLPRPLTPDP